MATPTAIETELARHTAVDLAGSKASKATVCPSEEVGDSHLLDEEGLKAVMSHS